MVAKKEAHVEWVGAKIDGPLNPGIDFLANSPPIGGERCGRPENVLSWKGKNAAELKEIEVVFPVSGKKIMLTSNARRSPTSGMFP